jgi:hypothetical protein|tara:strand:+ start:772 stop:1116 length:345 start_codon:yes stop_codon:yes gene_type:complete
MKWEEELRKKIIKQDGPANKMHGFSFRTEVDYEDLESDEFGQTAIIEWEFSFGQRIENMREIGIYVTDVIIDDIELSQSDIDYINRQSPEVRDKVGPSELIKYKDGEYDLIWSY